MASRSHFVLVVLSVLTTAALAATAADARPGQGQAHRARPRAPMIQEPVPQVKPPSVTLGTPESTVEVTVETSETEDQESLPLDGPVAQEPTGNPQNLPPGLQRQVDGGRGLPPGLQRRVDSSRGLPPGLQNR